VKQSLDNAPLGRLVAMAGHLATRRWGEYLAETYGITAGGAAVLMVLWADGESKHSHLAARCAIRPATLTGVVDTLERAGLVERVPAPEDRRVTLVALTESGAAIAEELHVRAHSRQGLRPITSIDADPAKEQVIRDFLVEMITRLSDPKETNGI
jgi:DNA-binding MarR family transcriptional regulator